MQIAAKLQPRGTGTSLRTEDSRILPLLSLKLGKWSKGEVPGNWDFQNSYFTALIKVRIGEFIGIRFSDLWSVNEMISVV